MASTHYNLNSDIDLSLIALSVFLAVFVAYACIEFTRCIVLAPSRKRKQWIIGGAIVLGIGLWTAQLASMYALSLSAELHYHLRPIVLSLLIAFLCAISILSINIQRELSTLRLILVSTTVGVLMTSMNMMGLQAIQVSASVTYNFGIIALATFVVILATAVVSRQAFKLRNTRLENPLWIHFIAVLVGVSVVVSYQLSIQTLTFSSTIAVTGKAPSNNIYAYQVLVLSAFAAFLLWGGVLLSRWYANEGVKVASRVAALAFGLVLLTAGTIGAVAFSSSKEALTQQQLKAHTNKLELEAIQLQSIAGSLLQDVLVLAHTPPIKGILRAQENGGIDHIDGSSEEILRDRLAAIFDGFLRSKPTYLRACYIGIKNSGQELVSVVRSGEIIRRDGKNPINQEVLKTITDSAKEKRGYQAFLSSKKQNSGGQKPVELYASVPIRNSSGELFGVVIINLDFTTVLNTVLQKQRSAHYFTNPNGDILYAGGNKPSQLPENTNNFSIRDIYPAMAGIINNPKKMTGNISYRGNHEEIFLNYRKIQISTDQKQYFLRITSTPYKNIARHVYPILNKFSTVILILIGISAMLASLLSRVITHPLKQMTLATKQFSIGDPTAPLPTSSAGEFGILARAFGDMISIVDEREKSIVKSEHFVRNIVESAADGLITVDENGTIITFNKSAQSIFGYTEDEVVGHNLEKLMPERFRSGHEQLVKIYTGSPKDKEKPLRADVLGLRKNNEEFPIEFSVTRSTSSETPLFIGIIRDITLREKAETNTRLVNKVLESTPEGIVITDAKGIIIRTNPAFEEITGFDSDEVVGKTPSLLKSGRHNHDFYKHMWQSITENGIWQGEIWDKRKNGEIYPKWLNISAIKNEKDDTTHYVGLFSDITERKEVEKRLEHLAHYDILTGLPNRALFHDRLLHSLEFARRSEKGLAVMMLDLDRFKVINDTLGHDIGDLLLIEAAKRLQECLRKVDTVARMGGDEFTIILSDLHDPSDAIQLAKVIINALSKPFTLSGHDCFVGASIGISSFPADGNNPKTLAKNADTAMYRAKEMGRNTYQLFNASMSAENAERLDIETKLRAALQKDELELYYQPQVNLNNGTISGMEALLRWHHSDLGMISPSLFIPIAKASGLIVDIGHWILRTACQQYKDWEKAGLPSMSIMVNLSAQQILQPSLTDKINELLLASDMPAEKLILEIAESTLLDFPAHAIDTLKKLSETGVHLAIDDFGTSYSSMGQLKDMPVQTIKIDQSFVQNITGDGNNEEIIKAIIAMARSLNLQVVAEGVESMEQLAFLKLQGCDGMQGYLYSPPLPLKAITHMLKNGFSPSLFGSPTPQ